MVTNIGSTSNKIVISDHATPASGTYAWYIPAESYEGTWQMEFISGTRQATPAGQAIGEKGYILDMVKRFRNISITNNTDWQNLLKALHYWEKNSTKLYLSVQNEWASNLALTGTYATPTTLVQFTGKLQNLRDLVYPNEVVVNVEMVYINA
jgi:hypothetical protein